MAIRGISLKFGENGDPEAYEEEAGELCSGIVVCPNCKKDICEVEGVHWADIKQCPIKKWTALWLKKTDDIIWGHVPEGHCYVCKEKSYWRLKSGGPSVCQICHPCPFPDKDVEYLDIPKNEKKGGAVPVLQKRKKPVKKEKNDGNQQKIFS